MRKILWIGVFILLLASKTWAGENFGTFGTATEVDDTCRLCFDTFDTLGHSANPLGDSIYVLRFVRGTLVDSTAASKLREYAWCVTKKAYDGSNLGQYTVFCYWRPCENKWYNDIGYYTVKPETSAVFPVAIMQNKRIVYVKTDGSADSSGLTPTAAVNSLRNALRKCDGCGAAGCSVVVAAGNYPAAQCSLVTIDSVNIKFVGAGFGRTILNAMATTGIFRVAGVATYMGAEITGFTMLGNDLGNGVELNAGHGCYIHDNIIQGFFGNLQIDNASDYHVIERNGVFDSKSDGISNYGDFCIIRHNVVDSAEGANSDLIAIAGGDHNVVYENYVVSSTGYGIHLLQYIADDPEQNLIANNFVATGTEAKDYPEGFSSLNYFVANQGISPLAIGNDDTTNTLQDDLKLIQDTTHVLHGETENLDAWDPASDEVLADMVKVSGQGAPADNLEKIYDENIATRGRMDLTQIHVEPAGGDSNAVELHPSGGGTGIEIDGDGTGIYMSVGEQGINISSFADGIYISSSNKRGMDIRGNEEGIFLQGNYDPAFHMESNAQDMGVLHIAHQGYEGGGLYGIYVSGGDGDSSDAIKIIKGAGGKDINLAGDGKITGGMTGNITGDSTIQIIRSGTAQAGAATSITLDASASAIDGFYSEPPYIVHIIGGTGANQARLITGYNGTSKVATVYPAWKTNPDNTSVFIIWPTAESEGGVIKIHR